MNQLSEGNDLKSSIVSSSENTINGQITKMDLDDDGNFNYSRNPTPMTTLNRKLDFDGGNENKAIKKMSSLLNFNKMQMGASQTSFLY